MARFDVYVAPRSSRPGPDGRHDGIPRLRLSAPPAEGAANAEAERVLSKLLGVKAQLVRGARSRRKTFEAEIDDAELDARIRSAFDGY